MKISPIVLLHRVLKLFQIQSSDHYSITTINNSSLSNNLSIELVRPFTLFLMYFIQLPPVYSYNRMT